MDLSRFGMIARLQAKNRAATLCFHGFWPEEVSFLKVGPATSVKEKSRGQEKVSEQNAKNLRSKYIQPSRLLDRTATDDCIQGRRPDLGAYVDIYIE